MIIKSLRSNVSTPYWVETSEAGRIGAAEGISGRVIFADFSSRTPGKIFRKNSDSPNALSFWVTHGNDSCLGNHQTTKEAIFLPVAPR